VLLISNQRLHQMKGSDSALHQMDEIPPQAIAFSRSMDDLEGALMKPSASSFKRKAAQDIGKFKSLMTFFM
jgi:hypothetical protein